MNIFLKTIRAIILMKLCIGMHCLAAAADNPVLLGSWPGFQRDTVYGVAVQGDYAYAASDDAGLQILNVSNPAAPVLVGGYRTSSDALGVVVSGNYAYVAYGGSGLRVIDVSNPVAPIEVGSYLAGRRSFAEAVAISGNYAYLAYGAAGMHIVDVGNPAAPVGVGRFASGDASGVAVAGNYAYLADGEGGLQIVDVSNPATPVRVGGHDTSGYASGVAVSGNHAYLADNEAGLQIVDVSNPAAPVRVVGYDTGGNASGLFIAGHYAYVADDEAGLQVIDVSNPAAPVPVGNYDTNGNSFAVTVSGNYAYVADGDAGLTVIDVSNPAAPARAGAHAAGDASGVVLAGNYAYLADGAPGLQVIDVSNPAAPVRVGSYDTSGYALAVVVSGNHAYVADGDAGLQVIDVSNPTAPVRVAGYDTSGYASGVAVAGNYAYVADDFSGLQVIDVSNPVAPARVGGYETSDYISRVAVSGNYAYVTADDAGFEVIDVSNPAAPVRVGAFLASEDPVGLAVTGNYAYVAYEVLGLQVLDVSNPAAPAPAGGKLGTGIGSALGYGVATSGNYTYFGTVLGVHVIEVGDPKVPVPVGFYDTLGTAAGVTVAGNYAYVADGNWGLAVLQVLPAQPATRVRLSWPAPEHPHALESAPAIDGPWSPLRGTTSDVDGQSQIMVGRAAGAQFFRLRGGLGQPTFFGPPISFPASRDRGPSLSADGLALYFFSNAPGHDDLFFTTRASPTGPWAEPTNLAAINTAGDEAFPSLSADGLSLFFTDSFSLPSSRPGNFGGADLWVSTRQSLTDTWAAPLNLGSAINTEAYDTTPAISSDGRTLIFSSARTGSVPDSQPGTLDLWVTTRSDATDPLGWGPPANLGVSVNSINNECCPSLSSDGLTLYFSSDRPSPGLQAGFNTIWVARRASPSEPFGEAVSLGILFLEFRTAVDPHVSPDGSTLFFGTTGLLSNLTEFADIWQAPLVQTSPPTVSISVAKPPSQP